jgi:hypothetical protein
MSRESVSQNLLIVLFRNLIAVSLNLVFDCCFVARMILVVWRCFGCSWNERKQLKTVWILQSYWNSFSFHFILQAFFSNNLKLSFICPLIQSWKYETLMWTSGTLKDKSHFNLPITFHHSFSHPSAHFFVEAPSETANATSSFLYVKGEALWKFVQLHVSI